MDLDEFWSYYHWTRRLYDFGCFIRRGRSARYFDIGNLGHSQHHQPQLIGQLLGLKAIQIWDSFSGGLVDSEHQGVLSWAFAWKTSLLRQETKADCVGKGSQRSRKRNEHHQTGKVAPLCSHGSQALIRSDSSQGAQRKQLTERGKNWIGFVIIACGHWRREQK